MEKYEEALNEIEEMLSKSDLEESKKNNVSIE